MSQTLADGLTADDRLIDALPVGIYRVDSEGRIAVANLAMAQMLGYPDAGALRGVSMAQLHVSGDDHERWRTALRDSGEVRGFETQLRRFDGTAVLVRNSARTPDTADGSAACYTGMVDSVATHMRDDRGGAVESVGLLHDVTDRRQAQTRAEFMAEILRAMNEADGELGWVKNVLTRIKEFAGVEAAGIRLREGEGCPYYVTTGFPGDFVEAESDLCARDQDGSLIRDPQGRPHLECMCGNVLSCRTNPELPFFTPGGSFWTNSTSRLLASTTDEDRLVHTRNRCNSAGYESVALIPLHSGGGRVRTPPTQRQASRPVHTR